MTPQELSQRIAQGEDHTFELKTSVPRPELIARILASLANTNGGSLCFGVQEPSKVVGIDIHRAEKAVESATKLLSPSPSIRNEVIDLDGKPVFLIHVERSGHLIAAGGAYYRRVGDSDRAITAEEIERHFRESSPTTDPVSELAAAVAQQTQTIEKLTEDFRKANSPWRKIMIGGAGAAAGAIIKGLLSQLG